MSKVEDQDKDQDLGNVPATSIDLHSSSSRSDAAGSNTNNNNINTVTSGGGLREEDVLLYSPAEALQKRPMGPLEARIFSRLDASLLAEDVNAPKTSNIFTNRRGEKFHFRHFLPASKRIGNTNDLESTKLNHVVIYLHGLDAHVNRPAMEVYGELLSKEGIGLFAFDQVGHGYSDGDRSYIRYYSYLIDDYVQFLRHIFVENTELAAITNNVKFTMIGQSMGGSVTAAMALLVQGCTEIGYYADQDQIAFLHSLRPRFANSILLCPAMHMSLPPYALLLLMQYCVVPLLPSVEVPSFLSAVKPKEFAWKDTRYIEYIRSDGFPDNPKGLTHSGAIRFATAQSVLDVIAAVREKIGGFSGRPCYFPFIVMHDPDDHVCSFQGSQFIMECSKDSPHSHSLVELKGGLHDLWTNRIDFICNYIIQNCKK